MKNNLIRYFVLTLVLCILLGVSLSSNETIDLSKYSTKGLELNYTVNIDQNSEQSELNINTAYSPYLGKSFTGFKEAVAFKESRGSYTSVNHYGYLGKYQFGKGTLKVLGINNVNQFLKNPDLQEKAFVANASRNKWVLRREIKTFVGKKINGVLITESGILAAAHLAGTGSVKGYLRSYGIDNFTDGFGTSVEQYIKRFSGYDTSFIKPVRKAKAV